jgi:hypothetical protein
VKNKVTIRSSSESLKMCSNKYSAKKQDKYKIRKLSYDLGIHSQFVLKAYLGTVWDSSVYFGIDFFVLN